MLNLRLCLFAIASVMASPAATMAMGRQPATTDVEATNMRIQPVARVALAASTPKAAAGSRSGEDMVKAVCGACHTAGIAGAPKTGDKTAWAPRIALGLDGLLKSAIAGKNAMPPKGGALDATDEELRRAIAVMANQSGASFE